MKPAIHPALLAVAALPLPLVGAASAASVSQITSTDFRIVFDAAGDSASLNLPVTAGPGTGGGPLDLFLLTDASSSFDDDRGVVADLLNDSSPMGFLPSVQRFTTDLRVGAGSFIDKPFEPFGDANQYAYRTDLPLTSDFGAVAPIVATLAPPARVNDNPEGSLEALQQAGLRVEEIGYRDDARRVVLLSTDDTYHVAGEGAAFGLPANNGDAVLDGSPPSSGEDFPSVDQVRTALAGAGVTPIFAVTRDFVEDYEELVEELGFGTVVEIESNSSDFTSAVTEGLEEISSTLTLTSSPVILALDLVIDPADGFTDVDPGETVFFGVDLTAVSRFDGVQSVQLTSSTGATFNVDATFVPTPGAVTAGLLGLGGLLLRRRGAAKE